MDARHASRRPSQRTYFSDSIRRNDSQAPATTAPRQSTDHNRPPGNWADGHIFCHRPKEKYPSWSRRTITTPIQLLRLAEREGQDIQGWSICQVRVRDVRKLGLDVIAESTEEDPGHCLVVPTEGQQFTRTIWSRLAPKALVVYTHPAGPEG